MGSIVTYVLRYGKVILAWGILLGAIAVFYASLSGSGALDKVSDLQVSLVEGFADLVSAVPSKVSDLNHAIRASLEDSNGLAGLLYWLCGFDVLESIVTYIIAQINTIMSTVVFVGTTSLVFAGLLWILRRTQRWIRVASGGDLNVDAVD